MFKKVITTACLVFALTTTTFAQSVQPFPAICMTTDQFSKTMIEAEELSAIIISYDNQKDKLFMISANAKRMVVVSISSLKYNNTCILSMFDDAEGQIDFSKLKRS